MNVGESMMQSTQYKQIPSYLSAAIQRGFTLLEMLVVMVLIGLLAGLVGPRIFGKVDTSKAQSAKVQIKMLESSLQIMRLDLGNLPDGETALKWLTKSPDDEKMRAVWKGPYIDGQIPVDPWNTAYQVITPGRDSKPFSVYSFGADGKAGGEDINSDIYAQ
jgi:general secretion pathway protein G